MKKIIISLLLMAAPAVMFAQLKVTSGGEVYIQRDSITGQSSLSVGSIPGMTGRYYDTWKMGLRSNTYNTASSGNAVGVFGEARLQNNNDYYFTAGVWGTSSGAFQDSAGGMNYGIMGTLHNGSLGAAVYGANCDNAFYSLGSSLAGFFYGPVHVEGFVNSTVGFISPSDMRLKKDVVKVKDTENDGGSTLDNLLGLEVLNYRLDIPRRKQTLTDRSEPSDDPNAKYASLRHYGVSAQELQKVFPDLVRENEEGFLSVNYVELVPLLIRSLQEMNQKLEVLEGKAQSRSASATGIYETSDAASGKNILYQNTPNPFKEQTTIRFSLADDARDAAICLFDMTGKMLKKLPISSGESSVSINGWELGEGMFLYTLLVNGREIDTKRMIITK